MEYGIVMDDKPPYKISGVLRFDTGKECKLTKEEMKELDDWVRLRIIQYGGKLSSLKEVV
jgi:hypothetical protein